jgi:hypothetical protein
MAKTKHLTDVEKAASALVKTLGMGKLQAEATIKGCTPGEVAALAQSVDDKEPARVQGVMDHVANRIAYETLANDRNPKAEPAKTVDIDSVEEPEGELE